ncbi:MAG TPA: XRE family transcriptional regulator [Chitinophagaceae bacterium]|nr:XRE family transcriptional regulator [Chitinophagaceae bacterium]
MSKISKNIKHLRLLKKWSQEQLAEQLEIPRARIGSYEEERCDPPIDTVIKISNLFHIAVDALVKCDLSKFDSESFMKVGENRILFPIIVDKLNNDMVEVVTMKASAGYLTGYADPEYIEKLPLMNLPFKTVGKHRAFPIQGDSMPPLKNGCYVIGKYIESINDIENGTTYIIITKDEGVVYKRIFKKGKQLELHSDNKNYSPYLIKMSDVVEIWKFVCTLNNSDKKDEEVNMDSIMGILQRMQTDIEGMKKK